MITQIPEPSTLTFGKYPNLRITATRKELAKYPNRRSLKYPNLQITG